MRREHKDNASGKQLPVRECWTGSGRAGVAKISLLKVLTFSEHPQKCDRESILSLIFSLMQCIDLVCTLQEVVPSLETN